MNNLKKHPKVRKELLLCTAIALSIKVGYQNLTRDSVAKEAGVSTGLVNRYFGTIEKLKKEVIKAAIQKEILEIVSQGLGMRDPEVIKAGETIKLQALAHMAK